MIHLSGFRSFNESRKDWTLFDDTNNNTNKMSRRKEEDLKQFFPYPVESTNTWERLINAAYRDGVLKDSDYQREDVKNIAIDLGSSFDNQPDKSSKKKIEVLDMFYKRLAGIEKSIASPDYTYGKGWILIIPKESKTRPRYLYAAKIKRMESPIIYKKKDETIRFREIALLYKDSYRIVGQNKNGTLYTIKPFFDAELKEHIGVKERYDGDIINLNSKNKTPKWFRSKAYNSLNELLEGMTVDIFKTIQKEGLIFYSK